MRLIDLFERDDQPRHIVATDRFNSDYREFAHKYKDLQSKLEDFLQYRKTSRPDQPFNTKDSPMMAVNGVRRCHLVHGRALLLYVITDDEIRLIDIVDHGEIDGKASVAINRYVNNLTLNSFKPFSIPAPSTHLEVHKLNANQKDELQTVVQMISEEDNRSILEAIARGDMEDFLLWARYALEFKDNSQDKAIITALGGRQAFIQWARSKL